MSSLARLGPITVAFLKSDLALVWLERGFIIGWPRKDLSCREEIHLSYDLYFKARNGTFSSEDFLAYFSGPPFYTMTGGQAWYENANTGVYFSFELEEVAVDDEGEVFPCSFNMNYFRPTLFVKEAEPEVTGFVKQFDLIVDDPQVDGMGTSEYDPIVFAEAWLTNNVSASALVINDHEGLGDDRPVYWHLPTERLEKIWAWNYGRAELQDKLGDNVFVPMIMVLSFPDEPRTACVWTDAIPTVIPPVDHLLISRSELAPRKWIRKKDDLALASWNDVEPLLRSHSKKMIGDAFNLSYERLPADIEKFVRNLKSVELEEGTILPIDRIIDTELIEKIRQA